MQMEAAVISSPEAIAQVDGENLYKSYAELAG
jgi:hypothetical protein